MALVSVPFLLARRMVLERMERIQCVVPFLEVPEILIIRSNNQNKNFINIDTKLILITIFLFNNYLNKNLYNSMKNFLLLLLFEIIKKFDK